MGLVGLRSPRPTSFSPEVSVTRDQLATGVTLVELVFHVWIVHPHSITLLEGLAGHRRTDAGSSQATTRHHVLVGHHVSRLQNMEQVAPKHVGLPEYAYIYIYILTPHGPPLIGSPMAVPLVVSGYARSVGPYFTRVGHTKNNQVFRFH